MSMPRESAGRWPRQSGLWLCMLLATGAVQAEQPGAPGAAPPPPTAESAPAASVPVGGDVTAPDGAVVETAPPPDPADTLAAAAAPALGKVGLFSGRLLAEFYAERDGRNVWDTARAQALLRLAQASTDDGFKPDDFHATAIRGVLERGDLDGDEATRTAADILLSDALLRYLHHFQYGKYDPTRVRPGATFTEPVDAEVLKAQINTVLAADDFAAAIAGLLPSAPFYDNLKRAYQRALTRSSHSGPNVPAGPHLAPGGRDPRVALLRQRLSTDSGLAAPVTDQTIYDNVLLAAVKAFQSQSGLTADGVVGPATLRALNQAADDRLDTLRVNLERMRWLYHDLPADYVFVDLTGFKLQLMRNRAPAWETRTVIGTTKDQTPMFREEMEYIVFNPDWTMPPSIQRKTRGVGGKYKVVDRRTGRQVSGGDVSNVSRYRIVQPPGPNNALGKVKFIFPNGHAIYLHDTPSKHLFANDTRAYSHGCVRVQNPLTLAEQILSIDNWNADKVNGVVRTGRTRYVHLKEHLPVLLYYLTALADDEGRVSFRRDVYGRDPSVLAVLDKPAHSPRIRFKEPEPPPVMPEPAPAAMTTAALRDPANAVIAPLQPGADALPVRPTEVAPISALADRAPTATGDPTRAVAVPLPTGVNMLPVPPGAPVPVSALADRAPSPTITTAAPPATDGAMAQPATGPTLADAAPALAPPPPAASRGSRVADDAVRSTATNGAAPAPAATATPEDTQ